MSTAIMKDSRWQEAAVRLQQQGYTLEGHAGLIPAVFTKPGEAPVYLVMPIAKRMADREWVPRPLAEKPIVFGVNEAAEHLGCAPVTIRHAVYRDEKNPLVPDQLLGGKRGLIFTEATLVAWNAKRPGAGTPATDAMFSYDRLYYTGRKVLLDIIKRKVISGDLDVNALITAILNAPHGVGFDRERLEYLARFNIDKFVDLVGQFDRLEIVRLIADDAPLPPVDGSAQETAV